MEYFGSATNKRLVLVQSFPECEVNYGGCAIGYLKEKGLLMDFAVNHCTKQVVKVREKSGRIGTYKKFLPVYVDDRWKDLEKVEFEGETYYVGLVDIGLDEMFEIYRELPKLSDDETFNWRPNKKHGTKEAKLVSRNFEYHCVARADDSVVIDVKYTKCDNKHRNKVTLSQITVYNATNDDILDAIKKWKEEFKRDCVA